MNGTSYSLLWLYFLLKADRETPCKSISFIHHHLSSNNFTCCLRVMSEEEEQTEPGFWAEAGEIAVADGPVDSKEPLSTLGEMLQKMKETSKLLQGTEYEYLENPEDAPDVYTACVVVRGQSFIGRGPNKKLARFRAAESAMQQLYGFEYDEDYITDKQQGAETRFRWDALHVCFGSWRTGILGQGLKRFQPAALAVGGHVDCERVFGLRGCMMKACASVNSVSCAFTVAIDAVSLSTERSWCFRKQYLEMASDSYIHEPSVSAVTEHVQKTQGNVNEISGLEIGGPLIPG
ncbi:hypothetical protein BaRGS_00016020 [Batillaria attramentaria]|uniref:DRBM domain-containing protein n=1 Tax=Batillaria attramentaria TaxID=370345 RepID=A0ABD0L0R9_9CAEN